MLPYAWYVCCGGAVFAASLFSAAQQAREKTNSSASSRANSLFRMLPCLPCHCPRCIPPHQFTLYTVNRADYPHIGDDPTRLVVFFSRMGYVRKVAYEEANRTGAAVYEIKAAERTEGTLGFWWCGRYGMHKWAMPIQPVDIDLSAYRHVTICSPIWVFALAAPVRSFCQAAAGQIREADYILVHHQGDTYENAAEEMDRLLGVTHIALRSIQCREGVYKERGRRK